MLDKKYRPDSLDKMFGNKIMLSSLKSVLDRNIEDVPKCILFCGEPGCGKTTLSRIVANKLEATMNNIKEYNIGHTGGVADARRMIESLPFAPLGGGSKVIILNEAQGASKNLWDCMLEVLEEPPPRVYFILCTTEPQKLPKPVRDNQRGMTFEVERLRKKETYDLISYVLKQEDVDDISKNIVNEIVNASQGSPRRALVILDSIIDMENEEDILNFIKKRTYDKETVIELCRALNAKKGWATVSEILSNLEGDVEGIRYRTLVYFEKVLLNKADDFASLVISEFSDPFYNSGRAGLINACYVLVCTYTKNK